MPASRRSHKPAVRTYGYGGGSIGSNASHDRGDRLAVAR